jgi:hypothetical protein
MTEDYLDVYRHYLSKFEDLFGDAEFDSVVQHQGQLVKKLRYEEFIDKWTEFKQIEDYLREVMSKGATLNDEVNRTYAELSANVLETPKDFMLL